MRAEPSCSSDPSKTWPGEKKIHFKNKRKVGGCFPSIQKSFPVIKIPGKIKPLSCISRKACIGLLRTAGMCKRHTAQVHMVMWPLWGVCCVLGTHFHGGVDLSLSLPLESHRAGLGMHTAVSLWLPGRVRTERVCLTWACLVALLTCQVNCNWLPLLCCNLERPALLMPRHSLFPQCSSAGTAAPPTLNVSLQAKKQSPDSIPSPERGRTWPAFSQGRQVNALMDKACGDGATLPTIGTGPGCAHSSPATAVSFLCVKWGCSWCSGPVR